VTNAPADLLGLRSELESLTGLSPVDIGIVGNGAHQKSGGYHEGKDTLQANGLWAGDYSVRLARDRNGCTLSASATDIGAGWRQGRTTWLQWNNLLANTLRANDPALAAVRAINYSPNGTTRWRIDRETGWRTESSGDTVDIHTHIEFYRDTEGHRQQALDRIVALAQQAITGQAAPSSEVDVTPEEHTKLDAVYNLYDQVQLPGGGATQFQVPITKFIKGIAADVAAVKVAVGTPAPIVLSPEQITEVAAALAGLVPTLEEFRAVADAAVKARLDGASIHTAGA